jgi:hypothetical protein
MWAAKHCSILFSSILQQPHERFYARTDRAIQYESLTGRLTAMMKAYDLMKPK